MTKQWQPLTDYQWAAISPFFALQRKRKHELRTIVDAIFWLLRTGCQWRNLPLNFPAGRPYTGTPARYHFDQWKSDGTLEQISAALNQMDRQQAGREAHISVVCIDSQSGLVRFCPYSKSTFGPFMRADQGC